MYNEKDIISKWNADMYDRNVTETDDVEFALSIIGTTPKHILEIACGSGRMLVPMAQAGHYVTGLDADEDMLEKIVQKAAGMENIVWRKADVTHEEWGAGFDVVMLAANFLFNIVSDTDYEEAQRLMIRKSTDALVVGGHLLIDYAYTLHPEEWFDSPYDNVVWEGADSRGTAGRMVLTNNTFDKESSMCHFIRRYEVTLADGTTIVQEIPSTKHFATLEQIHEWLALLGCVIEAECGDYQGNPISESTGRAIIWAKKTGEK